MMSTGDARVLIVGAGGLGTPASLALLHRGVRDVTILDPDRIELTNLHRQFLYREADVGRPKAEVIADGLRRRFPDARISSGTTAFDRSFHERLGEFDVVVEGTDRFETKLAISDACVDATVAYVFGGVLGLDGQVLGVRPHVSACLRCLFDEAPPPGAALTCEQIGVLGPIAGIVAARQAEVAVGLLKDDPSVVDTLWIYDGRRDHVRCVPLRRADDCRGCGNRRALRGASPSMTEDLEGLSADVLDLSGMACPDTYVRTRRVLESLRAGDRLWVVLTSDESFRGVPASAEAAGHRTLARISDGRLHRVLLEVGVALDP